MAIPFIVIGGFLGAGKTTLLNHVLSGLDAPRLAVLVNDFGAINLDACLIASRQGKTIALTNGCVCCSFGDDLSTSLIQVLAAQPAFDGIVVEASGVSDPWRIAQIGLVDPDLRLDSIVVLVDACAVLQQAADPRLADSLVAQLQHADLIVINKASEVNDATRDTVTRWCHEHAPGAVRVWADHARVAPALVLGQVTGAAAPDAPAAEDIIARFAQRPLGARGAPAHDTQFESWSQSLPKRLKPDASQSLRQGLQRIAAGILRLKALVRDERGWVELQLAGRQISVRRSPADAHADRDAAVVAIGLPGELPVAALQALFAQAL